MKSKYKPNNYKKISIKSLELANHFVQKWMKHNYNKEFDSNLHAIPQFIWADLMGDLESIYEVKWTEKDSEAEESLEEEAND